MVAAGVIALMKQPRRKPAAALAIGSLSFSLLLSLIAFAHVLAGWAHGAVVREIFNFTWFRFGSTQVELGWVLDPLAAIMLVMVSFVGLLIFIYSTGYMAHDENFTRFFCFLSLFAGAMLGVVISNSILLLFMCWEIVGLTSYLLIGFWYQKPSAAAAREEGLHHHALRRCLFLLGIVWLFSQTGTLLFYNHGVGSLEGLALANLLTQHAGLGLSAAGAIGLLIFAGAAGKSGQLPLHVWLPDAMEGPTPVSALIHAATMVAAGVYLVARVYPLMQIGAATQRQHCGPHSDYLGGSGHCGLCCADCHRAERHQAHPCLFDYFATRLHDGGTRPGWRRRGHVPPDYACVLQIAVVSRCGLGDSRLPRGAGRAAHGRSPRRYAMDLRHIRGGHAGPLRVPDFLLRFLEQGRNPRSRALLDISHVPYYLLVFGAVLTAFYMTRQVCYVFFGYWRGHKPAHESPQVMILPMAILAFFAMALGVIGTPAWPWFHAFLDNHAAVFDLHTFAEAGFWLMLGTSCLVVAIGIGLGWRLYGDRSPKPEEPDALEKSAPWLWAPLRDRLYVDEFYGVTVIAFYAWWARVADWLDRRVWGGAVAGVTWLFGLWAQLNRLLDAEWVDGTFDKSCEELSNGGGLLARVQSGLVQNYLRILAAAVVALAAILLWSARP